MKKTIMTEDQLKRATQIINPIYRSFVNIARNYTNVDLVIAQKDEKYRGAYPYIPTEHIGDILYIINHMPSAGSFVDLGCGVPVVPIVVNAVFPSINTTGYEFRDDIISKVSCTNSRVFNRDILTLTKHEIQSFDIIYYYEPLCDSNKLKQFEELILNNCIKGQMIIPLGRSLFNDVGGSSRFNIITKRDPNSWGPKGFIVK